ncbi:hypothetical protein V1514DRAFT_334997 [Lipomyces japonicus]|uniref:uncharacterized protein n=1 Tax=Lipomyces japonicus TaxID=56871 RepID=UPI0034CD2D3F
MTNVVRGAENVPYFIPAQVPAPGTLLSVPEGKEAPRVFTPLTIRNVTFQNRVWVSPMCQYSYTNGLLNDWTLVAIGSYAVRGASLVIVEASAVSPEGRITPNDAGLWHDDHVGPLKRVADFVHAQGGKIGIQIAHAGRKASTLAPWLRQDPSKPAAFATEGEALGFPADVVAPTAEAFAIDGAYVSPRELTVAEIKSLVTKFAQAAARAVKAGVDVIEIHAAHGYLLNEFLSPAVNKRTDEYGGSFENRIRFLTEVVTAIKAVLPENVLLFVRTSASDRVEENEDEQGTAGWTSKDTVELFKLLAPLGVDLADVSSSGNTAKTRAWVYEPAFNAPFAFALQQAKIPGLHIAPVGVLHDKDVIENTLAKGVDAVLVGRKFSHNPNLVLDLAAAYGVKVQWPVQIGYTTRNV